jgi:hypothetical protein
LGFKEMLSKLCGCFGVLLGSILFSELTEFCHDEGGKVTAIQQWRDDKGILLEMAHLACSHAPLCPHKPKS